METCRITQRSVMATAPRLSDQLSSEESEVISVFVFYLKNVFKNTFFNLEKSKEFSFTTQIKVQHL